MFYWVFRLPAWWPTGRLEHMSTALADATLVVPEQLGGVASRRSSRCRRWETRRSPNGPGSWPERSPPPRPTWPRCWPRSNGATSTSSGSAAASSASPPGTSSCRRRGRKRWPTWAGRWAAPGRRRSGRRQHPVVRQGHQRRPGRRTRHRRGVGRAGVACHGRPDPKDLRAVAQGRTARERRPRDGRTVRGPAHGDGVPRRGRHRADHPLRSRPRRAGRPDDTEILANLNTDHAPVTDALHAPELVAARRLELRRPTPTRPPPDPMARRSPPPRRLHRRHPLPPRTEPALRRTTPPETHQLRVRPTRRTEPPDQGRSSAWPSSWPGAKGHSSKCEQQPSSSRVTTQRSRRALPVVVVDVDADHRHRVVDGDDLARQTEPLVRAVAARRPRSSGGRRRRGAGGATATAGTPHRRRRARRARPCPGCARPP